MRRGVLKDYLVDMLNEETVKLLPDYDGRELLRIRDRHIAGAEDQATLMWLDALWQRIEIRKNLHRL